MLRAGVLFGTCADVRPTVRTVRTSTHRDATGSTKKPSISGTNGSSRSETTMTDGFSCVAYKTDERWATVISGLQLTERL